MLIDLLHNKIVKDTVTDAFMRSIESNLIPKLEYVFGESLLGVRMYEDHLADGFLHEGEWYYPLTVLCEDGASVVWISWEVDKKRFEGKVPYAYVGEDDIDFKIPTDVPEEFRLKTLGRAITYYEDTIPVRVHAVGVDAATLSGKYSQTFVDELARQITAEIGEKLGVEGLCDSTLELQLVFAPGTYMEHTSENITYRRLLLTGKGCQARDFWVKWERLDAAVGFSVSDAVSSENVQFTLGEDVPQKIREKEYRFLCGSNPEKYQSAMGKRTVTEWRELIKTALKRGEITKLELEPTHDEAKNDVDDKLRALLESMGVKTGAPVEEPELEYEKTNSELARIAFGIDADSESEEDEAEELEYAPVGVTLTGGAVSDIEYSEGEDDLILSEEADEDAEALEDVAALEPEESEEEEEFVFYDDADPEPFALEGEGDEEPEPVLSLEEDRQSEQHPDSDELLRLREARMRAELEAEIRREIEAEARAKAEAEQQRIREENERLASENERLLALARQAEEARQREQEARRLEAERIEREREAKRLEEEAQRQREQEKLRLEAEERNRLAETARLAIEEQRRLEAQRAEREARAREEAFRLERERLAREEEARREDERRREEERRRQAEAEARRAAIPPTEYMSKYLKLQFARRFDMNVLRSIKEIVEQTIVAEGKTDVKIAMKAYPVDSYTINLDITKIPKTEERLLLSIVQALGHGRLGISKIVVE